MRIEILGTGCYKCIRLESLVAEVVQALGLSGVEIVRISDERQIRHVMPLDEIPGLVIDGVLCSTREVPERETLVLWMAGIGHPAR